MNSQNNNSQNNTNPNNRFHLDQFLSSLRSGSLSTGSAGANQSTNPNLSQFQEMNNQQMASNSSTSQNMNLLNNRIILMRRDSSERNNERSQPMMPNRSSSYQYITSSNRANHLIIESQVINMSPRRSQSTNSMGQQLLINSSNHLDSENEHTNNLFNSDEKDYIFGTENLAVTTENIDFVKCTICMHIYQNPIACGNCLNHFCTFCLREWLTRNPNSCPLCKNFREMRCVPMLKNMLDKLQFFCTNKKNGCDEIIRYEQVIKHEDQCEYKIEICPILGCGQQMIKKLLEKHISDECEYVLSKCRWCVQSIKKRRLEEHEESCDLKEIVCELCGDRFKLKDQIDHDQKCPELIRECAWCSKKIKQKDIRDHEDCCGERIVRCQGCNYECCLNDHFLHNQSCQEIPVFCHRCQTKMKRKEQSAHTIEICIENIQKNSSQKIFQLENENRELRRQFNLIQNENKQEIVRINNIINKTNQNGPFSFSQIYKDQDIFVNQNGNIALVREYKKKRRDRFVVADQPKALLDSNQTITFKILSRRSEWFAIGICDESNVFSSRRYHDIGHLSYLISANGILYSSHSPNENWQNRQFQIEQDNIISVQFIYKPGPQASQNQQSQLPSNISNLNFSNIQILSGLQNGDQQQQSNNSAQLEQPLRNLANSNNHNSHQNNHQNINNSNDEMRLNEGNNQGSQNNNNNNQLNLQGAEMKLKFINHTENQELVINLDPKQILDGKFYYCACLRCPGDSVEILPNY